MHQNSHKYTQNKKVQQNTNIFNCGEIVCVKVTQEYTKMIDPINVSIKYFVAASTMQYECIFIYNYKEK